jgi:serine/threonine protein kinase
MLQQGMTFSERYVLLDPKGQGGMATIFRALDLHTNQMVALKHLNLPAHLSAEEQERRISLFEAEAQILGLLDHEHIMKMHEYIVENGVHVMILELLEGQELGLFAQQNRLTIRQKLRLFEQLLEALEYIHGRGIIHCDLKPENMMVIGSGQLKLLDFGIARIEGYETPSARDALVGTLAYMAPEQIQNSRISHPQSDIYALGVVMFELLTGRLPFSGDNPGMAMLVILNEDPPSPEQLVPQIGEDLAHLILTCLHKRPQHRFLNCRQLHQLLHVITERSFPESAPDGPPTRSYLPKIKNFENFELIYDISALIDAQASGQVILWNTFNEGSIWLNQGQILHADLKNKNFTPLIAFCNLVTWESGSSLFVPRQAPGSAPITPQGEALLSAARKYLNEFRDYWEIYQTVDIPEVVVQPGPSTRLTEAAQALIETIDGRLCMGQLFDILPQDRVEILKGLKSLEDRQFIFVDRIR